MTKKFEFKKEHDKCFFIMTSDEIKRTEEVSEQFARDHYKDLVRQRKEFNVNLEKLNADLKANTIEKDDELEKFIALANKAAGYKKYMDLQSNHKATLDMLSSITESMETMEKTLPYLKEAE